MLLVAGSLFEKRSRKANRSCVCSICLSMCYCYTNERERLVQTCCRRAIKRNEKLRLMWFHYYMIFFCLVLFCCCSRCVIIGVEITSKYRYNRIVMTTKLTTFGDRDDNGHQYNNNNNNNKNERARLKKYTYV